MALDQGTTSARCILYDSQGRQVSVAQKEFRQIYPQEGWVEHDPMDIWSTQIGVAQEALLKIDATYEDIDSIGITNQRETTVVWDRETGEPMYNAIVWQCRRTAEFCDELKARGLEDCFSSKTGLSDRSVFFGDEAEVDPGKCRWRMGAGEERRAAFRHHRNVAHMETDRRKGPCHGLFQCIEDDDVQHTYSQWDEDILKELEIPACMLPEVRPSSMVYGESSPLLFGGPITISGAAGDQQAALFGQTCFRKGRSKEYIRNRRIHAGQYGDKPVESRNGLITTIAWGVGNKVQYALEGSVFISGATIQWLRDEVKILDNAANRRRWRGWWRIRQVLM